MTEQVGGTKQKRFGTNAVTGLNVGAAEHLISVDELAVSEGGWTDRDAVWRTARDHFTAHTGTDIHAFTVGRMNGQDHNVYMDGNTLYDTGAAIGTITAGAKMRIFAMDDKFLILGAADGKNRLYDGNHVREQGAWQAELTTDTGLYQRQAEAFPITNASKASSCVLTFSVHSFVAGDVVYIENMPGMVELNGNRYDVLSVTATTVTMDVDSTNFSTFITSDGRIQNRVNDVPVYVDIEGATNASPCVITVASHAMSVGDAVWIDNVTSMRELNLPHFEFRPDGGGFSDTETSPNYVVTGVTGTTITIAVDSTLFSSWSASTGVAYHNACGLNGDYKFYLVGTIELGDGSILTGKTIPLGDPDEISGIPFAGEDSKVYTLSGIDAVTLGGFVQWINASVAEFEITGTIGVDYFPGCRLYRTKADGSDVYLEKTWRHGDADFPYTAGATAYYEFNPNYPVHVKDLDLGAVYTPGPSDHGNPPSSLLAAQVGQRVFVNDVDNPDRIYISHLDGIEYFNATGFVEIPDHVTVLWSFRDRLAIFAAQRLLILDMISGFPSLKEIDTSAGTIFPDAVTSNDEGLFFVKNKGVYHFDGVRVQKISRRGVDDDSLDDGQAAIVSNDTAIFITTDGSAMARIRDGGWHWHQARLGLTHTHLGQNSRGDIYGALPTKIEKLFSGPNYAGEFTSKTFEDGKVHRPHKVFLDIRGTGTTSVSIRVDSDKTAGVYQDATPVGSARQIVETSIKPTPGEQFRIRVTCTGNIEVFGYWLDLGDRS